METFLSIGKIILTIIEVVLLFNLMIVVHELGHYWAALWRGLKVDKFQIWFGKAIWKKKVNGVDWGMGWLPFGGFVALPQMAPMETIEGGDKESREALPAITPLDKILVAVAGPLFSLLLAVVLAFIVKIVGTPTYEIEQTTVVGAISEEWEGAKEIGLGDEIVAVNDIPVSAWFGANNAVTSEIAFSEGPTVNLTIKKFKTDETKTITVTVPDKEKVGVFSRGAVRNLPMLGAVSPVVSGFANTEGESPATRAGLELDDVIVSVNGTPVDYAFEVTPFVEASEGKPLELVVRRGEGDDAKLVPLTLIPQRPTNADIDRPMLGIGWGGGAKETAHPSVGYQIKNSSLAIVRMFRALFSSSSDIGVKDMSGPLMIGRAFYTMFADDGWQKALWFAVLINVNLAILNMMPLPVLDGGHIVLAIGEWIRKRPISGRVLEVVQTAFAVALLSLMAYVTILDGGSMAGGGGEMEPLKFPPAPSAE